MVLTFDTILSQAVRSIDLLHGITSSALRKKGLEVCAQPEKTLGYASTIDRHEKSGGSSNLHFDERRLAQPLCYVLIRSLVRLIVFVKGKLRNILHHESRSTGFIRNEPCRN
jgi:hypothetical protein